MTINQLITEREKLLFQIASVTQDLKEYIKYPVETVDIEQIKYLYGFILREIKLIDEKLKNILLIQSETLIKSFSIFNNDIIISISKKKFTVNDLPKHHFSMFPTDINLKP